MSIGKEHVTYDQELIYARIIGILASSRDVNFDDALACKFAAYPPSKFNPDEEMKISKSKSIWIINWPFDNFHVDVDAFKTFVFQALQRANITLEI